MSMQNKLGIIGLLSLGLLLGARLMSLEGLCLRDCSATICAVVKTTKLSKLTAIPDLTWETYELYAWAG